MIKAHPYMICL